MCICNNTVIDISEIPRLVGLKNEGWMHGASFWGLTVHVSKPDIKRSALQKKKILSNQKVYFSWLLNIYVCVCVCAFFWKVNDINSAFLQLEVKILCLLCPSVIVVVGKSPFQPEQCIFHDYTSMCTFGKWEHVYYVSWHRFQCI